MHQQQCLPDAVLMDVGLGPTEIEDRSIRFLLPLPALVLLLHLLVPLHRVLLQPEQDIDKEGAGYRPEVFCRGSICSM